MSVLRSAAGVQTDLRPFTSISHAPQAILKLKLTICSPTSESDISTYIISSKILFKARKRTASKEKKQAAHTGSGPWQAWQDLAERWGLMKDTSRSLGFDATGDLK
jgi:hypothetical protein